LQINAKPGLLNGTIDKRTPITKLFSHVDLIPDENHIKTKYYTLNSRKFSSEVDLIKIENC